MSANARIMVITAGVLTAAILGYWLLRPPPVPTPADIPRLLQEMRVVEANGNSGAPAPWVEKRVLGRYDNMARAGNQIHGRWANNIKDACIARMPVTSIPDEDSWQQPVALMQCFDGATVFVIDLSN